ncbi:RNA polymerase sigma factor [Elusimicrobiota bacterium]
MDTMDTDISRIIKRILSGKKQEFALLVNAHQVKVMSLCLSILRNQTEADDAAQEIFIKAYRNLAKFRQESSFSTWLYRITYYHCLDMIKARNRKQTMPLDDMADYNKEKPFEPDHSTTAMQKLEDKEEINRILEELSPEYRLVLTLRIVEDLSYDEIAKITKTSLDSVKARLKRARLSLQEKARHFHEKQSSKQVEVQNGS